MMLPVVRVLLERANSARFRFVELVQVLPDEMFSRQQAGDDWPVSLHVAHALSADAPLLELLASPGDVGLEAWLASLPQRRATAIEQASVLPLSDLLQQAEKEREQLAATLARVPARALDESAALPGLRTAWGEPRRITLYEYLEAWSSHDGEHEQAVRLAILARPDLSAVALTRRRR